MKTYFLLEMRLSGSSPSSSPLSSWTASSGMACICTPGAWGNMRKFSNKRCLQITEKERYYYTEVTLPWIFNLILKTALKVNLLCFIVIYFISKKKKKKGMPSSESFPSLTNHPKHTWVSFSLNFLNTYFNQFQFPTGSAQVLHTWAEMSDSITLF